MQLDLLPAAAVFPSIPLLLLLPTCRNYPTAEGTDDAVEEGEQQQWGG